MARLQWGVAGSRVYEAGLDRGVLYIEGSPGIPWNGLTSVELAATGGTKSYYLDGEKYLIASARERFSATINAFTYPPAFAQCDGSVSPRPGLSLRHQRRKQFGFSYRTRVGSAENNDLGYKIHLVYNALAEPSDTSYSTASEDTDPVEFSWSITTKPPVIPGHRRTSHVVIDSRTTDSKVLALVEDALYGTDEEVARLPSFPELVEMYDAFFVIVVTDEGNGIYTISGPDEAIQEMGPYYLQFDWPTVIPIDEFTYTISSG